MTTPRLLLTLAAALAPTAALAQPLPGDFRPPPQQPLSYDGYEVFRWILQREGLQPFTEAEVRRGPLSHSDYVVVVLGQPQSFTANNNLYFTGPWIDGAAARGGAVLVVYDSSAQVTLNTPPQGAMATQFNNRRVAADRAPRFANRFDAPFAVPVDDARLTAPEFRLFGGDRPLTRVATENPGCISLPVHLGQRPSLLAGYAPECVWADTLRGSPAAEGFFFAVGKSGTNRGGPYRFAAMADHAVFENGLMVSKDGDGPTDNLELAARTAAFLADGGEQKRTKCLLVENGRYVTNYDDLGRMLRPPLPLPKLPPWDQLQPKLVDFGNQILDKVQENDIPNRLVTGRDPDAPGSWLRTLLGVLAVFASVWAVIWLVRRVWGARQPTDIAPAPPGGRPPPPPDGAPGVFGRRGRELAARDNLLEPARAACRTFFDTVGRPPDPGPRLPKVVISDVVRRPETLRQALRDLWGVAYGRPTPVTAMRWAVLEPLIGRALAAHRDGKWRFVEAEAWPDVSTRPRGEA